MNDFNELLNKLQKDGSDKPEKKSMKTESKNQLTYVDATKEGEYDFRLFPDRKNPNELPFQKVSRHWWTNPLNKEKKASFRCSGASCPMCAFYKREEASGNPEAWKYKVQNRYIYYGINKNEKICLITMNYYANEEIKKKMISQIKAGINILDSENGKWVKLIIKKVSGVWKNLVSIEEEERIPKHLKTQFLDLKPLSEFYPETSDDDLKRVIKGLPIDKDLVPTATVKKSEYTKTILEEKVESKLEMDDSDQIDEIDLDGFKDESSELEKLAKKPITTNSKAITKSKLSSLWTDDDDKE